MELLNPTWWQVLKKDKDVDLVLPRGKEMVLQAEDKDYERGLLVKLLKNGGYEMAYWYDEHKPYPIEVLVDGKSIKKDAKKVTMKFHPELKKSEDAEQAILNEIEKEGGALGMKNLRKVVPDEEELQATLRDMVDRGDIFMHEDGDIYTHEPKEIVKSALESAWHLLKQYDPMRPAHMRSQVFPQMSSNTRVMKVPGGMLNQFGRESFYNHGYARQDVGEPYETRPAKTRLLMPHERRERILADRDQAIERANQFHQDRIDAMRNLPGASGSFSQGGADYNPFQPVNINNFNLDDPRVQQAMANEEEARQAMVDEEEARQAALAEMARNAVRQGVFSASYDRDPATMDPQTRSLFDAETQNMVDLHEQSRGLPLQTFQSERYVPR